MKIGPISPEWADNVQDATQPLSVFVTNDDIEQAIPADGAFCVFGRSAARAMGEQAQGYFYKTVALIKPEPDGVTYRYQVPPNAQRDVIVPLDTGRRDEIKPGIYTLEPPKGRDRLGVSHVRTGNGGKRNTRPDGVPEGQHYNPGRLLAAGQSKNHQSKEK